MRANRTSGGVGGCRGAIPGIRPDRPPWALLATTILTATSFRGGEVGKSWWYVVAGILLYYIANQLYTYLVLAETYATGSPIDTGWMLGFGLIAWAAMKTRNMLN